MRIGDPHLWVIQRPWTTACLFLGITLLFLWGNVHLRKGGILDENVILQANDPVREMDRYVQAKQQEGFEGREIIPFILNGGLHSAADLIRVLHFTEAAKATFGEGILSLSEIPAYHDTGEALHDDPYITLRAITSPTFDLTAWQDTVRQDPSVYGPLVGRDFAWTAVTRYLPPGYDEITEFRKTVEFLEGRTIPWWEWFWKRDITPQDHTVGVGGWVMGRGLIDQGMNVDMLTLVNLGVLFTVPIFWLALGSLRMALISIGVMLLGGFVWTRGAMGLLPDMHERVYSLLVYANVVVQGTSFALHKCTAFTKSGTQDPQAGWRQARAVDGLITTTALISLFGFATLWSFGLKPIRELGVASALGVAWLLVLAVFFLPALHLLGQPKAQVVPSSRQNKLSSLLDALLERLVSGCWHITSWLTRDKKPWGVVAIVCSLFLGVAVLFAQGAILSRTRSLDFLRGTLVEKEARFLNQPGNVGFEFLDLLVEPAQGGGLMDPHFLKRAWELQTALQKVPQARKTTSVLSIVHQIAQESYKKSFPETPEEIEAAFFLIENRLAPTVQRQLYFPGGLRLSVSNGEDDSVAFGHFCEAVLAVAGTKFPDLKVSTFNKAPLFPRVDHYVRQGKVIVADCLLNTLCFLPLVTSHFLPVRQIGWMMAVMLVACVVGTLIIMAALLPRCVVERRTV